MVLQATLAANNLLKGVAERAKLPSEALNRGRRLQRTVLSKRGKETQ